jgi:hypothetical protein
MTSPKPHLLICFVFLVLPLSACDGAGIFGANSYLVCSVTHIEKDSFGTEFIGKRYVIRSERASTSIAFLSDVFGGETVFEKSGSERNDTISLYRREKSEFKSIQELTLDTISGDAYFLARMDDGITEELFLNCKDR